MDAAVKRRSGSELRSQWARWAHGRLVYPAVVRLRGEASVFSGLEEVRQLEYGAPEILQRREEERLAEMLNHAQSDSPYYHRAWPGSRHISANDARARLAELPFITKQDLQDHVDDLRADPQPRRVMRKITGGSTGQAVTVYKDANAVGREMAASWLGYGWFGINRGDRAARFWGTPRTLKRRLRFAAADFAMHRIRFSAFAFDDADMEAYWVRCLHFRPQYFYGYVSMLVEFASFLERRGYNGRDLALTAIVTTSEVLASPQRALLQRVFGARVQNEYGCGEVGPIAYECERGSLHVMSQNVHVEVLKEDHSAADIGEAGEVVVTDLNNRAMPLVRYRLGDFAERGEPCSCGRAFPVLRRVWGRQYDFVMGPSGRRYHGEFLMYFFEDLRATGVDVRQFQVIQRGADRFDVKVVVPDAISAGFEGQLATELSERLEGVRVDVQRVAEIERAPSGKMRIILNPWLESQRDEDRASSSTD